MPALPLLPHPTLLFHHTLPPPPSASQQQIIRHYRPPTLSTLQSLTTPNLTIALFAPFLAPGPPRSTSCDYAQRILTAIYSLVVSSLRELGKTEGSKQDGGDVDVRVVFYWDDGRGDEDGDEGEGGGEGEDVNRHGGKWGFGPVFSGRSILGPRVGRRWMKVVYVVGGEGSSRPSWFGKEEVSATGVVVVMFNPPGGVEGGKHEFKETKRHEVVAGRKTLLSPLSLSTLL